MKLLVIIIILILLAAGCGSMDTLLQPKTINNSILITKMI